MASLPDPVLARRRREALAARLDGGLVILESAPMSARNGLPFPADYRSSSHILYFTGIDSPGCRLIIDVDAGRSLLFAPELSADDLVWHDPEPTREDLRRRCGADEVHPPEAFEPLLADRERRGQVVHRPHESPAGPPSEALIAALTALRLRKDEAEVAEMRRAMEVTARAHRLAMGVTAPGVNEREVQAVVEACFRAAGARPSYSPIATGQGEVLHACKPHRELRDGQLFLLDAGCELGAGYATDITRVWPVNGRFSPLQAQLYDIVLEAQALAIAACQPGQLYGEVHERASRVIILGLTELGLLRGHPDDIYAEDAHALFFPHGVGHLIGLDVHDLEDLGEDRIGYGEGFRRESDKLGRRYLRLQRRLEPGYVVTVEPGVYFIPAYLEDPKMEERFKAFVDFDRARELLGLGGIRIEDDIHVTEGEPEVLSAAIPKARPEVEALVGVEAPLLSALRGA